MNNQELINKIKQLEGLSDDERAKLVNSLNITKKYGLVWEEKLEDVEEQLRTTLPVLREVTEKRILALSTLIFHKEKEIKSEIQQSLFEPGNTEDSTPEAYPSGKLGRAPNHILIEGDNLHALTALAFTHEGKIDAMYFDPPYNTGAKDWKYNNNFVVKEDAYRHSKWLAMMSKRLKIAKKLLKEDGIICVTIDDYEMPRLVMLMEEIFGEDNHLGTIVIRINPSGRSTVKGVSITHEYGLFFGKSNEAQVGRLERNEKQLSRYDVKDETGAFEWVNFRKHGGTRKESPTMYYPIFITDNTIRVPDLKWNEEKNEWTALEEPNSNETIAYPIDDNGKERRWKWGLDRIRKSPDEFCVRKDRTGKIAVYVKARMQNECVLPLTWWDKKEYSATAYGTNLLKEIFGELQIFSYPKSIHAVRDSLKVLTNKKNAIILDIFAGSGTTLHATMQLNAEDGGNRQCILVTNNENNICEEVTYERNKRVIKGYTNAKGVQVEGLTNNNLRYYQSDYISRDRTHKNKRDLVVAATEMLCIKENIYTELYEIAGEKLKEKELRCFSDNGQYMLVVYNEEIIDWLVPVIAKIDTQKKIKIYIFAPGQYPFTEEFEDVLDKVELCALPDAIYKAYANVLPKKQAKSTPLMNEEENTETETSKNSEPELITE